MEANARHYFDGFIQERVLNFLKMGTGDLACLLGVTEDKLRLLYESLDPYNRLFLLADLLSVISLRLDGENDKLDYHYLLVNERIFFDFNDVEDGSVSVINYIITEPSLEDLLNNCETIIDRYTWSA